jgi:hypothetical protein
MLRRLAYSGKSDGGRARNWGDHARYSLPAATQVSQHERIGVSIARTTDCKSLRSTYALVPVPLAACALLARTTTRVFASLARSASSRP